MLSVVLNNAAVPFTIRGRKGVGARVCPPRRKRSPNRPTIDSLPRKAARSIQRGRKETGLRDDGTGEGRLPHESEFESRRGGEGAVNGEEIANAYRYVYVYDIHVSGQV